MNIRSLLLAVGLLLSGAVLASDCPNLVAEIDSILAEKSDLEESVRAQVTALRDEGQQLHESGNHDGSMEKLQQALTLLNSD